MRLRVLREELVKEKREGFQIATLWLYTFLYIFYGSLFPKAIVASEFGSKSAYTIRDASLSSRAI